MGRWAPDARGRLEQAAMELYAAHGFEHTTVVDIAERAGLTERTFFRHFADKREVLFSGAVQFQEVLVGAVTDAPSTVPALEVVAGAFASASDLFFEERRDDVGRRQAIVDANVELQERERNKLSAVASAMAEALRGRGVPDPAARLAAETGLAVFTLAFDEWVHSTGGSALSARIWTLVDELRDLTARTSRTTRR